MLVKYNDKDMDVNETDYSNSSSHNQGESTYVNENDKDMNRNEAYT